jgi:hypothetical protein
MFHIVVYKNNNIKINLQIIMILNQINKIISLIEKMNNKYNKYHNVQVTHKIIFKMVIFHIIKYQPIQ